MPNSTCLGAFLSAHKKLQELGVQLKGRSFTPADFTKTIRKLFSDHAQDMVFKTYKDYAIDPDTVIVAGLYDSEDDLNLLPSVTITLCYHPEQDLYFPDLLDWEQFSFDLAECMGHELVHKDQCNSGRKNLLMDYISESDEQEYLGGEDEIEAYAFSIAAEMYAFQKPMQECVMYGVYQETFASDARVILLLEKQVEEYRNNLEQINE